MAEKSPGLNVVRHIAHDTSEWPDMIAGAVQASGEFPPELVQKTLERPIRPRAVLVGAAELRRTQAWLRNKDKLHIDADDHHLADLAEHLEENMPPSIRQEPFSLPFTDFRTKKKDDERHLLSTYHEQLFQERIAVRGLIQTFYGTEVMPTRLWTGDNSAASIRLMRARNKAQKEVLRFAAKLLTERTDVLPPEIELQPAKIEYVVQKVKSA